MDCTVKLGVKITPSSLKLLLVRYSVTVTRKATIHLFCHSRKEYEQDGEGTLNYSRSWGNREGGATRWRESRVSPPHRVSTHHRLATYHRVITSSQTAPHHRVSTHPRLASYHRVSTHPRLAPLNLPINLFTVFLLWNPVIITAVTS